MPYFEQPDNIVPATASHEQARHPRRRVLMVTDSRDPSGVGTHMLTLAASLQDKLLPILVFAREPTAIEWARRSMALGIYGVAMPIEALERGDAGFAELLREFRPDIVHVHAGIGWEGHALARAARCASVPAVIRTEHLPYTLRALRQPALERAYANGALAADRIVCVSDAARATFRMSGIDAARYVTIHNGIEPSRSKFSRSETRARLGIGEAPMLITVARLTEQKRHDVLLHALPRVLRHHPDTRLLLVGCGPLQEMLQQMADDLGVADHVRFLGWRNDIPDLLVAADAFCLPSYFEGHPLVLMEAMEAGLPVVAARSLGITEVISNGETGLLVPFEDPVAMAAAINRVLSDEALGRQLGRNGRLVIRERFGSERMAKRVMAVYDDVLASPSARTVTPACALEETPECR